MHRRRSWRTTAQWMSILIAGTVAAFAQQQPPVITSVTPNSGQPGTTVSISIQGTGFYIFHNYPDWYTGTSVQVAAPLSVNNVNVSSANSITATLTIPANASGAYSISVTVFSSTFGGYYSASSNSVPFSVACNTIVGGGATIPAGGGSTTFYMSTGPSCQWTLSGVPTWASCSPASGTGTTDIGCTAGANSGALRTASLSLLGQSFPITQAAGVSNPCTITAGISSKPIRVLPSGGSGVIPVSASANCSWTASSDSSWLTIGSGASGVGSGSVQWSAGASNSASTRTGNISIRSSNTLGQAFSQTGTAPVSLSLTATVDLTPRSTGRAPAVWSDPLPRMVSAGLQPRADPASQPIAAGSTLRFSESATNRGTGNATATTTCNVDPAIGQLSCSVTTGGACNVNGSTVTTAAGTLGSGQSSTLNVSGVVQQNLPNGRTLSTTCRVDSTEANSTDTDSTTNTPLFVVDPGTPQYTLALDYAPGAGGSISTNPVSGTAQFLSGTSVEITAIPAPGYQFTGWTGDLTGTTNPQTVTMTAARSVRANFAPLSNGAMRFVSLAPCRVLDTRNAAGPFGGPSLAGGGTRDFPVSASSCGVPGTALAYSLNVTAVPRGSLGYLTVWPAGQPQPVVSTLNSDGRIKANAAIVPAGNNGSIRTFATDTTDLVADINGYFVPVSANDPNGLQFFPVTPCRIADTRDPVGTYGGPALAAGQQRSIPVAGKCGIPSSAKAFSLNMTAVPQGTLSYLTVWPAGQAQPYVSTLNSPRGVNLANAAIVPAGTNGAISLYVTDTSHMVVDVNGYFATPGAGGLSFYSLNPCRIADTRNTPNGSFAGPVLNAGEVRSYAVPQSTCGVPSTAQGYVFNATVVPQGSLAYLTMYPAGVGVPGSSTLNAPDGSITSNAALVPAGTNGAVNVFTLNSTHFLFDISGYFAP